MASRNRLGHFLEYLLVLALHRLLAALPARWGRGLGRGLGRAVGALARGREVLARQNLSQAFPSADAAQVRDWIRECWANLGQAVWEFARVSRGSVETYRDMVDVEGLDLLKGSHAQGKGVILFTAHHANWELTTQFIVQAGMPLAVIARRMKNPYVNDFVTKLRSAAGLRVFMHREAVRESMRWLRRGGVLGLLIDQRITDGGVRVPFFGRPAHTTTMPALLALRMGAPVHPVHARREGGRLKVRVEPAMDLSALRPQEADIVEATARMTAVVEGWVRAEPPLWLWIHDRWK